MDVGGCAGVPGFAFRFFLCVRFCATWKLRSPARALTLHRLPFLSVGTVASRSSQQPSEFSFAVAVPVFMFAFLLLCLRPALVAPT